MKQKNKYKCALVPIVIEAYTKSEARAIVKRHIKGKVPKGTKIVRVE